MKVCVQLSDPHKRNRIGPGDLVMRKYEIKIPNFVRAGLVVERDRNSFLTVMWGAKVEYMWDEYDLIRIE